MSGSRLNKPFLVRFSVFLRTVPQRPQHMLKYCTGLQLVGFGQAFPDSSNHFAHERIGSFPQTALFAPAKFVNDLKDRFFAAAWRSHSQSNFTLRLVMGTASGTERAHQYLVRK